MIVVFSCLVITHYLANVVIAKRVYDKKESILYTALPDVILLFLLLIAGVLHRLGIPLNAISVIGSITLLVAIEIETAVFKKLNKKERDMKKKTWLRLGSYALLGELVAVLLTIVFLILDPHGHLVVVTWIVGPLISGLSILFLCILIFNALKFNRGWDLDLTKIFSDLGHEIMRLLVREDCKPKVEPEKSSTYEGYQQGDQKASEEYEQPQAKYPEQLPPMQ